MKKMSGFSNSKYVNFKRGALRAKSVPKETGQVIPTQNKRGADYTCQVYGVAMSGINWKKLLWAIR